MARVELSDVHAIVLCLFRGDGEMKKILLTVFSLLLLLCLPREVSAAEETYTEGYFQYEIVSNCHVTYVGIPGTDTGEGTANPGAENGTAGETTAPGTENGAAGEGTNPGAENETSDNADAGIAENGEASGSGAASGSENHGQSGSGSIDEAEVVLEEPVSESNGQTGKRGNSGGKDGSSGGADGKDSASGGTACKDGTSTAKDGSREAAGSEQSGGYGSLFLFAAAIAVGIAAVVVRRKKKGQ